MKNSSIRLIVVAGVLFALVAGTWALGGWGPRPKPNIIKCPQPACTDPCDTSQTVMVCSDGRNGKTWPSTYACCCCNEDSQNRFFHGE